MRRIMLGLIFILLLLLAVPVLAQGEPGLVASSGSGLQMLLADSLRAVLLQLSKVIVPFAGPVVALLVAILKPVTNFTIPGINWRFYVPSNVLAFVLSVIVGVGFVGATELGYGGQFESIVSTFSTVSAAILSIIGTQVAARKTYDLAKSQNVYVLGYSRKADSAGAVPTAGAHG